MNNRYIQIWLALILILVLFPPASTNGLIYEGHMFIAEIGKFISRPGGGYIQGEILWKRLFFEGFIVSIFVLLLKSLGVFERLERINKNSTKDRNFEHRSRDIAAVVRRFVIPTLLTILGLYLISLTFSENIGAWGYMGLLVFLIGAISLISNYNSIRGNREKVCK